MSAIPGFATDPDGGDDAVDRPALFDGDTGDAPADCRTVITFLMKHRVVLGDDHPDIWSALLEHETMVVRHFHNMFVDLVIERAGRIAFKQQLTPDHVPFSVTVRAVTLSREASVLALYARERLLHALPGESTVLTKAEARSQMEPYWPVRVANRAARDKAVNAALDTLTRQDLLLRLGDDEWEVSPAVALVITAQAVARFTDLLTEPEASQTLVSDVSSTEIEEGVDE